MHAQLKNMCLDMQSLKQDRIVRPEAEEICCLKCKGQGHEKDHCPVFVNYIIGGSPMPLRPKAQERLSAGPVVWCTICQVGGKHMTNNFHLLQKFVQTTQQLL